MMNANFPFYDIYTEKKEENDKVDVNKEEKHETIFFHLFKQEKLNLHTNKIMKK